MKKVQNPLVEQKLYEGDLIAKVLNGRHRNPLPDRPSWGGIGNATTSHVIDSLPARELEVIVERYNLAPASCQDTSVAGVAVFLNITEDETRTLETSAIKRLQEPACFGYFVKGFGSKKLLMETISQEAELGHDESLAFNDDDLVNKANESELAQFLEAMETTHNLLKRWARRVAESSL